MMDLGHYCNSLSLHILLHGTTPTEKGPYIRFEEWKGFGFGEREKTAVSIEKQ